MNILLLYAEFFKIGLFAVGGGLATLPFLFQMADTCEWLNPEAVGNFLAIAQSSPGPIGVNMAVQTGYQAQGIAGGVIAALGLVSPAVIIITVLSKAFASIKDNKITISVFSGLRPAAAGLLAAAAFSALKLALVNTDASLWYEYLRLKKCIILAVLFLLVYKLKLHPVIYIALGAAAGIVLKL